MQYEALWVFFVYDKQMVQQIHYITAYNLIMSSYN
jgi:hypothetical protein